MKSFPLIVEKGIGCIFILLKLFILSSIMLKLDPVSIKAKNVLFSIVILMIGNSEASL